MRGKYVERTSFESMRHIYALFELFTQTWSDNLSLLSVWRGVVNDSSIRNSVRRQPSIHSIWRAYYVFDISALLALPQRNEKHPLRRTNRRRLITKKAAQSKSTDRSGKRKIFAEWELITRRDLFQLLREEIHHWARAHSETSFSWEFDVHFYQAMQARNEMKWWSFFDKKANIRVKFPHPQMSNVNTVRRSHSRVVKVNVMRLSLY